MGGIGEYSRWLCCHSEELQKAGVMGWQEAHEAHEREVLSPAPAEVYPHGPREKEKALEILVGSGWAMRHSCPCGEEGQQHVRWALSRALPAGGGGWWVLSTGETSGWCAQCWAPLYRRDVDLQSSVKGCKSDEELRNWRGRESWYFLGSRIKGLEGGGGSGFYQFAYTSDMRVKKMQPDFFPFYIQWQDRRQWSLIEIVKIPFKFRENLFSVGAVEQQTKLTGAVLGPPSLEMLKANWAEPWAACCCWPCSSHHGTTELFKTI